MRAVVGSGLYYLGIALVGVAVAVVVVGYAGVAYTKGIGRLLDMLSPFNVGGYLAVILTLAPGAILMEAGKRVRRGH